MAFASLGSFISAAADMPDPTWSPGLQASAGSGRVLVVMIAKDNAASGDAESGEVQTVRIAVGAEIQSFTKLKEWRNGQGAADAGATASLWYVVLNQPVDTTMTLDIAFSTVTTAKAATGWIFSRGASTLVSDGSGTRSDDALDPGAITLAGLTNRQHIYVRGTASEAALGTYTATAGYTAFDHSGSTVGAGDTAMTATAEFKIATSTGDTSDPTVMSADHASVMAALAEIDWGQGGGGRIWPSRHRRG